MASTSAAFLSDPNLHHHHHHFPSNRSSQFLTNLRNTISVGAHGQHTSPQTSAGPTPTAVIYIDNCSTSAVREALKIMYGGELRDAKHCVSLALDILRFGCLFLIYHLISLARASCLAHLMKDNCLCILLFATRTDDAHIVDRLHQYARHAWPTCRRTTACAPCCLRRALTTPTSSTGCTSTRRRTATSRTSGSRRTFKSSTRTSCAPWRAREMVSVCGWRFSCFKRCGSMLSSVCW